MTTRGVKLTLGAFTTLALWFSGWDAAMFLTVVGKPRWVFAFLSLLMVYIAWESYKDWRKMK